MGKDTQQKAASIKKESSPFTREFSSGGVVYKKENGNPLWLVRKTSASTLYPDQHWMLPKGHVDDTDHDLPGPMASGKIKADEKSLQKAAIREVAEETGVEAEIKSKIGTIKYSFKDKRKGNVLKFVTFYLMEWKSDLPEGFDMETEEVKWLVFDEAYKTLSFSGEKNVLKRAKVSFSSL